MENLLNAAQVAMMLGVSTQTLAVWRMTGQYGLPWIKVGRQARYARDAVERWMEQHTNIGGGK